jgi:hypothetical protein
VDVVAERLTPQVPLAGSKGVKTGAESTTEQLKEGFKSLFK